MPPILAYSRILAKISESRKRKYSFARVQFLSRPSRHTLNAYLFTELDRVSAPSRQENLVSRFNRGGNDLSVLVRRARSDGNYGSLWQGVGCRRLGEEDTGSSFLMRNQAWSTPSAWRRIGLPHRVRLEPLDQDAIEERYDSLDAFESRLSSLQDALTVVSR